MERIVSRYDLIDYGVFGVARQHFKSICYLSKVFGYKLLIYSNLLIKYGKEMMAWDYSCDDIQDEFIS